jgi:hypothetical protein
MRTDTNTSWWRQLGAISQGMLFLDGQIATADAAKAAQTSIDTGNRKTEAESSARSTAAARQAEYTRQMRQMTALSLFR